MDDHPRDRSHDRGHERLVAALVLDAIAARRPPPPAPMPSLPTPRRREPGTPGTEFFVAIARIDRSGRLREKALLAALGWGPGQALDVDTAGGGIVFQPAPGGRHALDSRGALRLPAPLRQLCGITIGPPVLLQAAGPPGHAACCARLIPRSFLFPQGNRSADQHGATRSKPER